MWNPGALRQRRRSVLDRVIAAAAHGDHREPWLLVPGVWETYRGPGQLLVELHRQWRTALAGAVYVAIETGQGDLAHDRHGIRGLREERARDREGARRDDRARGWRPEIGRPDPDERPAHRRADGRAPVGVAVRPNVDGRGRVRDPGRDRRADRRCAGDGAEWSAGIRYRCDQRRRAVPRLGVARRCGPGHPTCEAVERHDLLRGGP